jgi:hypothetical protein
MPAAPSRASYNFGGRSAVANQRLSFVSGRSFYQRGPLSMNGANGYRNAGPSAGSVRGGFGSVSRGPQTGGFGSSRPQGFPAGGANGAPTRQTGTPTRGGFGQGQGSRSGWHNFGDSGGNGARQAFTRPADSGGWHNFGQSMGQVAPSRTPANNNNRTFGNANNTSGMQRPSPGFGQSRGFGAPQSVPQASQRSGMFGGGNSVSTPRSYPSAPRSGSFGMPSRSAPSGSFGSPRGNFGGSFGNSGGSRPAPSFGGGNRGGGGGGSFHSSPSGFGGGGHGGGGGSHSSGGGGGHSGGGGHHGR